MCVCVVDGIARCFCLYFNSSAKGAYFVSMATLNMLILLTATCRSTIEGERIVAFSWHTLREHTKLLRHRLRLKCNGTRAETRFRLSAKRNVSI